MSEQAAQLERQVQLTMSEAEARELATWLRAQRETLPAVAHELCRALERALAEPAPMA